MLTLNIILVRQKEWANRTIWKVKSEETGGQGTQTFKTKRAKHAQKRVSLADKEPRRFIDDRWHVESFQKYP